MALRRTSNYMYKSLPYVSKYEQSKKNMEAIKELSGKSTQKDLDDIGELLQDISDDKNLMRVKYEFNKRKGGSVK